MIKTVVLAAGKGSRLKSKYPKVLHKIFDKPVLSWVFDSLAEVPQDELIVVSGYKADLVESFLHAYPVTNVRQETQMGTGDALKSVVPHLKDFDGTLLVMNGDTPLIKPETLNNLVEMHKGSGAQLSLLTCELEDPSGYGRIIKRNNKIIGIKEEKDCSEAELAINEVNAGVYCFDWNSVKVGLKTLKNNNAQEEYYLTDLISWAYNQGINIGNYVTQDPLEVLGINTRRDIATVIQAKNIQTLDSLMENGVTIIDPSTTVISPDADISPDTVIYPGTYIHRRVVVGRNCTLGPNTSIFGPAEIGDDCNVIQSHVFRSTIGNNCNIGPFAHVRDGTDIADNVRVGNFVEVKNSQIDNDVAAAHLSYLGDCKVKSKVNIGAGTVTANFDSRTGEKSETVIKSGVSTGSNSVLVAPIEVGEDSIIAAGSVVTEDVPSGKLAIARPRQEHKELKKAALKK